jgi:hypothetical protein
VGSKIAVIGVSWVMRYEKNASSKIAGKHLCQTPERAVLVKTSKNVLFTKEKWPKVENCPN